MFNQYTTYWNAYVELLEQQLELTTQWLELCKFPGAEEQQTAPPRLRLVVNND